MLRTTVAPVAPYRLDLTVQALRRVSSNIVDVLTPNGTYLRALRGDDCVNVVEDRPYSCVVLRRERSKDSFEVWPILSQR